MKKKNILRLSGGPLASDITTCVCVCVNICIYEYVRTCILMYVNLHSIIILLKRKETPVFSPHTIKQIALDINIQALVNANAFNDKSALRLEYGMKLNSLVQF